MGIFLKDLKPTGWMGFHVKVFFFMLGGLTSIDRL